MFVGGGERGQRLLLLLEHAHKRQDLLAQALVLVDDAAEVFAQMAQLRLGRVYALVARLDDADDLGEVVLGGGSFLGGRVGGCSWSQCGGHWDADGGYIHSGM